MQDVFERGFADRSKDIFNFSRDMIAAFVTMSIIQGFAYFSPFYHFSCLTLRMERLFQSTPMH